ncbi:MAG: hypothetical protein Kow00122_15980 [Thermoleophilia bacterium]
MKEGVPTNGSAAGVRGPLRWSRMLLGMVAGLGVAVVVVLVVNPHVGRELETAGDQAGRPALFGLAALALAVALAADAASLVLPVRMLVPEASRWGTVAAALEAHLVGGATSFGGLEIPYQVMRLRRLGLSVSQATSAVIVKGFVHTMVLVGVALAALLPRTASLLTPLQRLILVSATIGLGAAWLLGWLWLRRPLGVSLVPERVRRGVFAMRRAMADLGRAKTRILVCLVALQVVYWVAMFALLVLILLAYGWRGGIWPIVVGQAVVQVLMPLSPLPGGGGVAELGYLSLIGPSVPESIRLASLVVWRATTWLIPVGLGALTLGLRRGVEGRQ